MTSQECVEQLNRLKKAYGQRAYTQEFLQVIWSEFSQVSAQRFDKAITRVIGKYPIPPNPEQARYWRPPGLAQIEQALTEVQVENTQKSHGKWREEWEMLCKGRGVSKEETSRQLREIMQEVGFEK